MSFPADQYRKLGRHCTQSNPHEVRTYFHGRANLAQDSVCKSTFGRPDEPMAGQPHRDQRANGGRRHSAGQIGDAFKARTGQAASGLLERGLQHGTYVNLPDQCLS